MRLTMSSIVWSDTGRFLQAVSSPRLIFSRSNTSRRPSFLITYSVISSTFSYVVKRFLQARHSRRRRTVAPALAERESMTLSWSFLQKGQRIEWGYSRGVLKSCQEQSRERRFRNSIDPPFFLSSFSPSPPL